MQVQSRLDALSGWETDARGLKGSEALGALGYSGSFSSHSYQIQHFNCCQRVGQVLLPNFNT